MDRFPERMSNRYDRGLERERFDREDRYARDDRYRAYSYDMSANVAEAIDKSNRMQMNAIADCFDDTRDYLRRSEEVIVNAIENNNNKIEELEKSLLKLQEVSMTTNENKESEEFFDQPSVDPSAMKEILRAVDDNKALLTYIRQDLINIAKQQSEEKADDKGEEEFKTPDLLTIDQAQKLVSGLEEHVHSENVKCYRNVQAALSDHDSEGIQTFLKSLTGVKVVSIISLLTSLSTLALLVIYVFGLIKF